MICQKASTQSRRKEEVIYLSLDLLGEILPFSGISIKELWQPGGIFNDLYGTGDLAVLLADARRRWPQGRRRGRRRRGSTRYLANGRWQGNVSR
jgi:hypothetical protein